MVTVTLKAHLTEDGKILADLPSNFIPGEVELVIPVTDSAPSRKEVVRKIDALRGQIFETLGKMPDNVDLLREDCDCADM